MTTAPATPAAAAQARRIAARRGQLASVAEFLRRNASPVRRAELLAEQARKQRGQR